MAALAFFAACDPAHARPASKPVGKSSKQGSGPPLGKLLDLGLDPREPHALGFEPRPPETADDDPFAFGQTHAVVHHILGKVTEGDAMAVASALDAFSAEHSLGLGLGDEEGNIFSGLARGVIDARQAANSGAQAPDGLRVLSFHNGIGAGALRLLPTLLAPVQVEWAAPHEVVTVEHSIDLLNGGAQLFDHAIGNASSVRHTPMMPSEDTTVPEVLESLRDGYGLQQFDVVLLGGGRGKQLDGLEALFANGSLGDGAVVHARGPVRDDPGTLKILDFLADRRDRVQTEVRDLDDGGTVVTARLKRRDAGEL